LKFFYFSINLILKMLKNIPNNISPELMQVLMSMGHGDEIVLADGNFPAATNAQRLIRASGVDVISLLQSIIKFFPIDLYVEDHCLVMKPEPSDFKKFGEPPIWKSFEKILKDAEGDSVKLTSLERQKFYERAKKSYAIVATSETALYANLIIKKGVVVS